MPYKETYPSVLLTDAVEAIGSLPGVGRRSALRLALHLLRQPAENVHHFTEAIGRLRDDVCYCRRCHMIADGPECAICADQRRDHRTICVVESVRDVMSIEATGQYHGVYHVLGGIISPIAGIGPSDLSIKELTERVFGLENPQEAELILALTPFEALSLILQQTVMPSDKSEMSALLELMDRLMETVPMYRLSCNISDEAVTTIHDLIYKSDDTAL